MAWTAPADHTASVVTVNEWNAHMGTAGNLAYLKAVADAPMKAQKDGGSVLGGRAKINFITGTSITLTVADNPGSDRIDVTIAQAGATFPTDATDYGVGTAPAPASPPNWGAYQQIIAATAYTGIGLLVSVMYSGTYTTIVAIAIGASPGDIVRFNVKADAYSLNRGPYYMPFAIASGTKISARHYASDVSATVDVGVTVMG